MFRPFMLSDMLAKFHRHRITELQRWCGRGPKFLKDLSTFKLQLFGMLSWILFFSKLFSSLAIFFSIPQTTENSPFSFLLSLCLLGLDWHLGTLIRPVYVSHYSFHILLPQPVLLLNTLSFDVFIVCRNKLTKICWTHVSFMMHSKSSLYQPSA